MLILSDSASNRGTYIIVGNYTDESGLPVLPRSTTWSLTDEFGNIINNRANVVLGVSSSFSITLSGDDLDQEDSRHRIITLNIIYDSALYGNNLLLRQQASFTIEPWITPESLL